MNKKPTILVVDDEKSIVNMIEAMLRKHCRVLKAFRPSQAIDLASNTREDIDLVITDVTLPEMDGVELEQKILEIHPGTSSLFLSGLTKEELAARGISEQRENLLLKPCSIAELTAKVQKLTS